MQHGVRSPGGNNTRRTVGREHGLVEYREVYGTVFPFQRGFLCQIRGVDEQDFLGQRVDHQDRRPIGRHGYLRGPLHPFETAQFRTVGQGELDDLPGAGGGNISDGPVRRSADDTAKTELGIGEGKGGAELAGVHIDQEDFVVRDFVLEDRDNRERAPAGQRSGEGWRPPCLDPRQNLTREKRKGHYGAGSPIADEAALPIRGDHEVRSDVVARDLVDVKIQFFASIGVGLHPGKDPFLRLRLPRKNRQDQNCSGEGPAAENTEHPFFSIELKMTTRC